MQTPIPRSTREVVESHLDLRQKGDLETDLAKNYADDVILLSAEGVHRGHDGLRKLAAIHKSYAEHGSYRYRQVLIEGDMGMLQWSASGPEVHIHDGADSYVVRDGLIHAQTIHYSTTPDDDLPSSDADSD